MKLPEGKVAVGVAVAVGLIGGAILSNIGGPKTIKPVKLGSTAFPEWTRDGSAYRCKDGKVQGCISGSNCGTAGRTGTDQPVAAVSYTHLTLPTICSV